MRRLTLKNAFLLWLPLASTWLLMAFEGPFLQSVAARLSEPKLNLAALGVAFGIAFFAESPILPIITASNSLVSGQISYIRMRNFTFTLSFLLTLGMLVLLMPVPFYYLTAKILNLPAEVRDLSRNAFIALLSAPFFVGYRRLYQGILIRRGKTKEVGICTIVRLAAILTSVGLLSYGTGLRGAEIGAIGLSCGFVTEAVVVRFMVHSFLVKLSRKRDGRAFSYSEIAAFYLPLASTSMIIMATQPLLTLILARAPYPVESLAVFPVVNGFSFLFCCLVFAAQELIISRLKHGGNNYHVLRQFSAMLCLGAAALQAVIVFTPLCRTVFSSVYGLTDSLVSFALLPAVISLLFPFVLTLATWSRSILIHAAMTFCVTKASIAELIVLISAVSILVFKLNMSGVTAAIMALLVSRLFGYLVLLTPYQAVKGDVSKAVQASAYARTE